ncbi:UPF0575 protein C19orf67 homolog [Hippoglossus stenolepis]|uniref:UPF0575 protein C19orf67 homolog n=1 Tax=Hippoglossus stenolepis TaxID=195615 RepID=UPI001FAED5A4|nr:UPF0575 protein C19orf67 homolog [Hippoglossus stenolepis]
MRTLATAEDMTGVEGRVELQLENSPPGHEVMGERPQEDVSAAEGPSESGEGESNSGQRGRVKSPIAELEEEDDAPLSVLADVAPAPPRGDTATCSWDSEARSCPELGHQETCVQSMRLQLQFLLSQADDLMNGQDDREREAHAAAVPNFLWTCQPYFNYVESTAQSSLMSQHTPLPYDIHTKLLDFSQQLCDKLEQLVLTHARHSLLCLDESNPNSLSHFCIGQTQLGQLRLTAFRYCKPTPYLAQVDTGLYKRMRWNVETLPDKPQQADEKQVGESEEEAETVRETEYYFLCYEDIPNAHADAEDESQGDVVRMWSIGRWVQVKPDPDTEDIHDWITCELPQADYHRLLFLGSKEPSSCNATELLKQLLLSKQTTQ